MVPKNSAESTNPLVQYFDYGVLSDEALVKIGTDELTPIDKFNCSTLLIRIAVVLRDFFDLMQCTKPIANSLNTYFKNRAIIIIKNQNCQFVKKSFKIDSDFHGWCLIEKILEKNELERTSLIKGSHFYNIIEAIYNQFLNGDKAFFRTVFSSVTPIEQNHFLLCYEPDESTSENIDSGEDSNYVSINNDDNDSLTESESLSDNKEEKNINENKNEKIFEKNEDNIEEKESDKNDFGQEKINVENKEKKESDSEMKGNSEIENEPISPKIEDDKKKQNESLNGSNVKISEPKEQSKTTSSPHVDLKSSQKSPLSDSPKPKNKKLANNSIDILTQAFFDDPILFRLKLLGSFLKPVLDEKSLKLATESLQKTVAVVQKCKAKEQPKNSAIEKLGISIKSKSLEVMKQLKTDNIKKFLNCLGKEKRDSKSSLNKPLNLIQTDEKHLSETVQKMIPVVEDMYKLEVISVNESNKTKTWWKDDPKKLSEKIGKISTYLKATFAPLVPTKFTLKTVLESMLRDYYLEIDTKNISNSISPFIDILVDNWDKIETKYQIYPCLTQLEAFIKKIEQKPDSEKEAVVELNKLLTLTFDTNMAAFYGAFNDFLSPVLNAEKS